MYCVGRFIVVKLDLSLLWYRCGYNNTKLLFYFFSLFIFINIYFSGILFSFLKHNMGQFDFSCCHPYLCLQSNPNPLQAAMASTASSFTSFVGGSAIIEPAGSAQSCCC